MSCLPLSLQHISSKYLPYQGNHTSYSTVHQTLNHSEPFLIHDAHDVVDVFPQMFLGRLQLALVQEVQQPMADVSGPSRYQQDVVPGRPLEI